MKDKRRYRLASQIHHLLCELFLRKIKDPKLCGITVTSVELTENLKEARVFYRIREELCPPGYVATPGQIERHLSRAKGYIRSSLAADLNIRFMPRIEFVYDRSLFAVDPPFPSKEITEAEADMLPPEPKNETE